MRASPYTSQLTSFILQTVSNKPETIVCALRHPFLLLLCVGKKQHTLQCRAKTFGSSEDDAHAHTPPNG
jgi:hypothetical protein